VSKVFCLQKLIAKTLAFEYSVRNLIHSFQKFVVRRQMMPRNVHCRINTPKVTSQIIDGEAIIINLESGNYYNLNSTGTDIWDGIEKGVPVCQIAEAVAQRYDGEQTDIENSVSQLITDLEKEELIVIDGSEEAASHPNIGTPSSASSKQTGHKFEAPVLQKYTDMQDLLLLDPIHEVDELGWPRANDGTVA
jgi:hypothetical protein